MSDDNAVVIEAWNTILFDKFCRFKHLLVDSLAGHSDAALARQPFSEGARVLDVGCGFGDSAIQIASQVGRGGQVVGVDCASNFVAAAETEARAAGVDNVRFRVADVQFADLGGPYDHAFSRFGTMFFNLPGAAMANLRRAVTPGGTLRMIVWRRREDNPWIHDAEKRVKALVPAVEPDESGEVHCGPGPFSMAGADLVSEMLTATGWMRVCFERFDRDICIGRDLDEGLAFAKALGPAGEMIRLAGEAAAALEPQLDAALREALAPFVRADGQVWAPSSSWFVTAENPG